MVFPGGQGGVGGMGFRSVFQESAAPPATLSGSHGARSQVGGWQAPLTSPGLAHQGHDLAWGQREAEVSEHGEAGAAGVAGRRRETLRSHQVLGPLSPWSLLNSQVSLSPGGGLIQRKTPPHGSPDRPPPPPSARRGGG